MGAIGRARHRGDRKKIVRTVPDRSGSIARDILLVIGGPENRRTPVEKELHMIDLSNTLTTRELAARLRMNKKTIYQAVRLGAPAIRLKNNRLRFMAAAFQD